MRLMVMIHGQSGWGSHVVGTQLMKNSKGVDIFEGYPEKTQTIYYIWKSKTS